jgi:hypothetical protein
MVDAPNPTRAPSPSAPLDLVGALVARLSREVPTTVLVFGDPGAGKSILLRTVVQQLAGEVAFVAYRVAPAELGSSPSGPKISLLLLDAAQVISAGTAGREVSDVAPSMGVPPENGAPAESYPPELAASLRAMAASGGGTLVVDSWDRRAEETYRRLSGVAVGGVEMTVAANALQEQLGRVPVPSIVAMFGELDPAVVSVADCAVSLIHEEIDGTPAHVVVVEKSAGGLGVPERQFFTTSTGEFYCPPPRSPPPVRAIRVPDPDLAPGADGHWPGSAEYARVFGRLRHRAFTAIELFDDLPSTAAGVFVFPMIAWTLLNGGRVVWIPSPLMSPGRITRILAAAVPPELIQQSLRVLSGATADPSLGDLGSIVLPVRKAGRAAAGPRSTDDPRVDPMFPEVYAFLNDRPGNGLSLFALSIEGLRAVAALSGTSYDPATFPLIAERYLRIPHFHGVGIGRSGDPLGQALLPAAETWLRMRQRYGQVVVTGVRPSTPAQMLDWNDAKRDYSLISLA